MDDLWEATDRCNADGKRLYRFNDDAFLREMKGFLDDLHDYAEKRRSRAAA